MLRRAVFGLCFFLVFGGLMAHAGQFLDAPQYTVGTNPQAVAVADFNNDGIPDMAVVNTASNSVSILIGNGDGTFTAGTPLTTGNGPYGIAAGNFGNGQTDLVVTNSTANTVSVFVGNGDGTFHTKADFTTGASSAPEGVAVGDFNGDGNLDFVVTNSGPGNVGVFLNSGGSTGNSFAAQATYNTGFAPISVVVGNFHNKIGTDNILDIAVANKNSNDAVSVLINKGNGTFNIALPYTITGTPVAITAGDFNGDGFTDLAVAALPVSGSFQATVNVFLNNATTAGSFAAAVPFNIGSSPGVSASPTSIAAGVFKANGNLDLVVTSGADNSVNLLVGDGTGNFGLEVRYGTATTPYSAVVAALIPGGNNDIVVANSGSASVSVLIGNGDETFQTRRDFDSGPQPNSVVVGDFNGDGIPDLAFANGDCAKPCTPDSVSVILGNGDGTFQQPNTFATGIPPTVDTDTYALVAADFNNDGILDIAAVNNNTGTVSILLGEGVVSNVLTFQTHVDYTVGNQPTALVVGDFNGDGYPDLAVANFAGKSVTVLLNNGKSSPGTFAAGVTYTVGNGPIAIARGNFTSANAVDLVVVNATDKTYTVLLNNGSGVFTAQTAQSTGLSGSPSSIAIGRFDSTTNLSLAIGDSASTNVSILVGNGDGTFKSASIVPAGVDVFSLVANDFNGDGFTDLAVTGQSKTGNTQNLVAFLLGNGNDGFTPSGTTFPVGSQSGAESQSIAFGDFNNDGALDLAVANGLSSDVSILLNTVGTNMTLVSSAGNPSYGAPVTLTATIAPSVPGTGALTGTITFENGSTVIGSPQTVTNGSASITTPTLPVGTDTVNAVYSGNFPGHIMSVPVTVSQAGTTTFLAALTPVNLGQTVTFTATVCPGAGCPASAAPPSGTVTFLDGTTTVGTGTVNSSGVATSAAISLLAGTHSITAAYPGDTNYLASVSPAGSQVVNGPAFTFAATPLSPGSVAAGASSTSTITITPTGGLSPASVVLSCSSIAPAVIPAPACSFSAITVSGGVGTSTLTVTTTGAAAAIKGRQTAALSAVWLMLPAAVIGSLFVPKAKRGKLVAVGLVALIAAGCVFQVACGGGSPKGGTGTPQAAATSTAVTSSANPAFTGQAVTFTAAVTSSGGTPTGSVTFLDGTTTLGTGTLASGSATFQTSGLAAGTHSVTASYAGDSSFNASTSTAVSQVVNASTASNTYAITVTGTATGAATQTTGLSLTVQ